MRATRIPLQAGTKLVVRVLQDLVARECFECYADLTEALKCRLAQLKIRYHGDAISEAIARLEQGGTYSIVRRQRIRQPSAPVAFQDFTPQEAQQLYQALMNRYDTEMRSHDAPSGPPRPAWPAPRTSEP